MNTTKKSVCIIAEAGVNHNGDPSLAKQLIEVAADSGADMVKFQSFRSALNISPNSPKAAYQERNTGDTESQFDMVRKLELSVADHHALFEHAKACGIRFLSTPFDSPSVVMLQGMGITVGKVPSGEITNKPHLRLMARTFPELIVSTGMCTVDEVGDALEVLYAAGADRSRITLLHCNTEYPTPFEDVNLQAMVTLGNTFGAAFGYSDHTLGIEVPIAATALGASIIEKHFTLDRSLPGPDHRASLEPNELCAMVNAIRNVSNAMGSGKKAPSKSELPNIPIARKSIHLAFPITAGALISESDLVMLRPGDGISPMRIDEVVGMRPTRSLSAGHKLAWTDLA